MKTVKSESVTISAPNLKIANFTIRGTSWLVINKFSDKARRMMKEKMEGGSQAAKGKKRGPRDFADDYEQATHKFKDGTPGIPATAFRAAMITACKLCGFKMTIAKLALRVVADGFEPGDGTPLIKFKSGKREPLLSFVKNATGVADLRNRPKWDEWTADLRIRFDADMFTVQDISNLLMRAGQQVGICAGRPSSEMSGGMEWGLFEITGGK